MDGGTTLIVGIDTSTSLTAVATSAGGPLSLRLLGMDLDTFDQVAMTVLAVMVAAVAYSVYQTICAERGFRAFIRERNFRTLPPASTMWLARVIENAAASRVVGEWDGLPVAIYRNRNRRSRGMTIVVTADHELVDPAAGNVTLGPWTNPPPPALLQHRLVASACELRLHIGETRDPSPYVAAAVAYARTLARQLEQEQGPEILA